MTKEKEFTPTWTLWERTQLTWAMFCLVLILVVHIPFPKLFEKYVNEIMEFYQKL